MFFNCERVDDYALTSLQTTRAIKLTTKSALLRSRGTLL
jgi:hypothetical protein